MSKTSIVCVLVLGFVSAACKSAKPPADPADAPADESCAGCDQEAMPAPVAKAATVHELKPVKPSASYPLTTCLVTDKDLGDLEERAAFTCDGTEVQFCCPGCLKGFKRNPELYLAKLKAAK